MGSRSDDYQNPNISFSGCDMVATITIPNSGGELVSLIMGSLQTLSYSVHSDKKPIRSIGKIGAKAYVNGPRTIAGTLIFAVFNQHFVKEAYQSSSLKRDYNMYAKYILADEIPPFDITVSMANEYGAKSRMAIYGVTLLNEGKTISVNDIYTENTYQFLATDIEYLEDMEYSNTLPGTSYEEDEEFAEEADYSGEKTAEELRKNKEGIVDIEEYGGDEDAES